MAKIINAAGISLVKQSEGFSPSCYLCPSSIWTLGYGSLHGLDGARLDGTHRDINEVEGEQLLRKDLSVAEYYVAKLIKVPVTSNQFSSLVSICFNIGSRNFQNSTFRMKLNRGDYQGCADNFWQWRRGAGRIFPGLVKRRAKEKELFLS